MWVSVHSYCLDLVCVHQNGSAFPLGSLLGYDIMLWPQPGSDETGAVAPPEGSRTFNGGNTLAKGTVDGRNIRSVGKTLGPHPAPLPPMQCSLVLKFWADASDSFLRSPTLCTNLEHCIGGEGVPHLFRRRFGYFFRLPSRFLVFRHGLSRSGAQVSSLSKPCP